MQSCSKREGVYLGFGAFGRLQRPDSKYLLFLADFT